MSYFKKRIGTRLRLILRSPSLAQLVAQHIYGLISRTVQREIRNTTSNRAQKDVEVVKQTQTLLIIPKLLSRAVSIPGRGR